MRALITAVAAAALAGTLAQARTPQAPAAPQAPPARPVVTACPCSEHGDCPCSAAGDCGCVSEGGLRWVATSKPGHYALYRGWAQLGNWRVEEGAFYDLILHADDSHSWRRGTSPAGPPPAAAPRRRAAGRPCGVACGPIRRRADVCPHAGVRAVLGQRGGLQRGRVCRGRLTLTGRAPGRGLKGHLPWRFI